MSVQRRKGQSAQTPQENSNPTIVESNEQPALVIEDNKFRSNIDHVEQPRQIIALVIMVAFLVYMGFNHHSNDPKSNFRSSLCMISLLFLLHCFLQLRDTIMVRPHPGVWRVIHGMGMLYLFALTGLLFYDRNQARELVRTVFPDLGPPGSKTNLPNGVTSMSDFDCTFSQKTFFRSLTEIWFFTHVLGWWGKMCIFRHWGVCLVLSIGFEIFELTLQFIIPEFKECWWDSLFMDFLGANCIGLILGSITLRLLESRSFDWSGYCGKANKFQRMLARFSPFLWRKYQWKITSSFKRFVQVLLLITVCLTIEINAFFLLAAFDIPKSSVLNVARLILVFLIALAGAAEYYEFISNPKCNRLGPNGWVILAIMHLEIVVWFKFLPQRVTFEPPPEVSIPWVMCLLLFILWILLFYGMEKKDPVIQNKIIDADSIDHLDNEDKKTIRFFIFKYVSIDWLLVISFLPLIYLGKQWGWSGSFDRSEGN